MSGNQEMFESFKMLSDSVKGFSTAVVMKQAAQELDAIQKSELKDEEKRAELKNLSDQFTLRLAGMGADATQITAAMKALTPPDKPLYQTYAQKALNAGTQAERDEAMALMQQETDAELAAKKDLMKYEYGLRSALENSKPKNTKIDKSMVLTPTAYTKILGDTKKEIIDLQDLNKDIDLNQKSIGTLASAAQRVKTLDGKYTFDEKALNMSRLEAKMLRRLIDIRVKTTGAAFSEKEVEDLRAATGDTAKQYQILKGILEDSELKLRSDRSSTLDTYAAAAPLIPGYEEERQADKQFIQKYNERYNPNGTSGNSSGGIRSSPFFKKKEVSNTKGIRGF